MEYLKIEMSKNEVLDELDEMISIPTKTLMGIRAYHKIGDLSRDKYEYFQASGETENCWIGRWCDGLGFVNVCFPKSTSRILDATELKKISKN